MKDTPAFPQQVQVAADGTTWFDGVTLRDYFAAKAMQGLLAGSLESVELGVIARDCYRLADAMLKAREQ
jgi:hypothetical protein